MIESLPLFEETLDPSMDEVRQFLTTIYPKAFKEFWTTDPAIANEVHGIVFNLTANNTVLPIIKKLTVIARRRPSLAHFGQFQTKAAVYSFYFLKEEDCLKFKVDTESLGLYSIPVKRSDFNLNYFDVIELYKRNRKFFNKTDNIAIDAIGSIFESIKPVFW